jgi:hypothetical protein
MEKVAQKCELFFLIFKSLPKVNDHPLWENSPNLVTLLVAKQLHTYVHRQTYAVERYVCMHVHAQQGHKSQFDKFKLKLKRKWSNTKTILKSYTNPTYHCSKNNCFHLHSRNETGKKSWVTLGQPQNLKYLILPSIVSICFSEPNFEETIFKSRHKPGWPDEFEIKPPKMYPNHFC